MGVILGKTEHIKYKKVATLVVLHFLVVLINDLQIVKTLTDRRNNRFTRGAWQQPVTQTIIEYICMVFIRYLTLLLPFVVQYHFT